jgi:hypothetical protein
LWIDEFCSSTFAHVLIGPLRELVRRKTIAALQPRSNQAEDSDAKREKLLWVEKYAPKSFSQLLSHEKTNREVLKAVKEWDPFVFKTSVPKFAGNVCAD